MKAKVLLQWLNLLRSNKRRNPAGRQGFFVYGQVKTQSSKLASRFWLLAMKASCKSFESSMAAFQVAM